MTAALRDRVLSIGADPRDTADERFRKRLLVGVALVILPIGFVWGCLYWLIGEHGVALTPWAYVTGSAISLAVFARNRNFAFLRTAQLLLILVAPALGTVMLGGFRGSSGVILWSLFAPLGAVAFDRPTRAWPWFAAFVATIGLTLPRAGGVGRDRGLRPAPSPSGERGPRDVANARGP
jgi:adenylate cyclase